MYSAIWKRPQRMPEYSVWYPATSSLSASGRSNGARADSATPPKRKTRKPTACGTTNQSVASCFDTMSVSCERLAHEHDAEHAERERHLVRDELRARAHRSEQRVLRLRRPAADDEPVDADRAEREDEDQRDRHVQDLAVDVPVVDVPTGPVRDHGERREGRERRDDRRDDVRQVAGGGREEALLADQLDQVGDRLQQPYEPARFGP